MVEQDNAIHNSFLPKMSLTSLCDYPPHMYSTIMNDVEDSVRYSNPLLLGGCVPIPLGSGGTTILKDVQDILRYGMTINIASRG